MRITIKTVKRGAICVLFYLLAASSINAQINYQKVDSLSFVYYMQGEWTSLIEFGETAVSNNFDFYYLNLRVGIAHYKLENFKQSEKWLNKALANNVFGELAKEYLFWIYWQNGREIEAAKLFEELPEKTQNGIDFNPKKWIDFVYLENGLKFSPNQDTVGLSNYTHLGLQHKIAPYLDIYHAYTFYQQDFSWGDFRQHQYHFAPTVHLPKGWDVGLGGNYFDYKRNFEFNYDSTTVIKTDTIINDSLLFETVYSARVKTDFIGQSYLTAWYPTVYLSKSWHNINLSLQYAWYGEQSREDFLELSDTLTIITIFFNNEVLFDSTGIAGNEIAHNNTAEQFQHQIGLTAEYTWRFSPIKSLLLGLESQIILRDGEDLKQIFIPYFYLALSKKISINGYWMQKGNHPLSIAKGSLVFNNYDQYKNRISTTFRYQLSAKASLFTTLQWEQKVDAFTDISYESYGVFTGFKMSF